MGFTAPYRMGRMASRCACGSNFVTTQSEKGQLGVEAAARAPPPLGGGRGPCEGEEARVVQQRTMDNEALEA